MSETFIVAAVLPMTRASYEQWLDAPLPAPGDFEDWASMFRGWYWQNVMPSAPPADAGASTPRAWIKAFSDDALRTQLQLCLAVHRDDHLLFHAAEILGPMHDRAQQALAMLRSAAPYLTAPGYAAYWAETSGRLVDAEAILSLCAIDRAGSRFVRRDQVAQPDAAIATLEPVDALYCELLDAMNDEESSSPNADVFLDARFIDPAISGVTAMQAVPKQAAARKSPSKKKSAPKSKASSSKKVPAKKAPAKKKPTAKKRSR